MRILSPYWTGFGSTVESENLLLFCVSFSFFPVGPKLRWATGLGGPGEDYNHP